MVLPTIMDLAYFDFGNDDWTDLWDIDDAGCSRQPALWRSYSCLVFLFVCVNTEYGLRLDRIINPVKYNGLWNVG
ncbi:hypothetical protein HK100_006353, partial [Physocladia obscura]